MQRAGSLGLDNYISQPDLDPDSFFFQVTTSVSNWFSVGHSVRRTLGKKRDLKKCLQNFSTPGTGHSVVSDIYFFVLAFQKNPSKLKNSTSDLQM